jgi:VWFA-related protein
MPLLILAVIAFAGYGTQEATVFRTDAHLVQINVIVRDKHGPVTNLEKGDFILTDNGKPRTISLFSVHKRAAMMSVLAKTTPAAPTNTFSNRRPSGGADAPASVTMILLDRLNTLINTSMGVQEQTPLFSVGQAIEAGKQQLLKFINELDPKERVAIYSLGESLTVLSDLTGDRAQLRKVIEDYRATSLTSREVVEPMATSVPNLGTQIDRDRQLLAGMTNAARARTTMTALVALAAHVAGISGRKNLVWLTSDLVIPPEALGRALSRSQIAIYPVDVRGLQPFAMEHTQADADARAHDGGPWRGGPNYGAGPTVPVGLTTMQVLADETGGRAFVNNNDLTSAIRQALEDGAATYTLGFYVDASSLDGKFHELKVRARRAALDVRTQKGYFALNSAAAENDVSSAITSPLESSAIRILARVEWTENALSVSGSIDLHDLRLERNRDSRNGAIEIELVQQDATGASLERRRQDLHLQLTPEEYETYLKTGIFFRAVLKPRDGLKTLRVVVTESSHSSVGSIIIPISEIK